MGIGKGIAICIGVLVGATLLVVLIIVLVVVRLQTNPPEIVPGYDSIAFIITFICLIPVAIILLKKKFGNTIKDVQ